MQTFTAPIVGMYHRPPALSILKFLPALAPLTLACEPDNPHDSNAVAVYCLSESIPAAFDDDLEEACAPFGFSAEEIRAQTLWQLGYISRDYAAHLAPLLSSTPPESVTLGFNAANKPFATITIEV